jgi:hypothetical protein
MLFCFQMASGSEPALGMSRRRRIAGFGFARQSDPSRDRCQTRKFFVIALAWAWRWTLLAACLPGIRTRELLRETFKHCDAM